jgi:hypothetical protein
VTFQLALTTAVAGQRMTMSGTGAQKGPDVKMSLRMRAGGMATRFDAILLQEWGSYVMYMRSPLFQAQLPAGSRGSGSTSRSKQPASDSTSPRS